MNTSELSNIKSDYELFNVILFNNSLPRANEIDFILHDLTFAAGFSRHRPKPSKTGNIHEIAFCKYNKFTQRQIREILIHEMIHLWQDTCVAEWRYKKCTNDIAHDRVFMSKMATINIILERKGFDLKISDVFKEKLYLDENVHPTKKFRVIFFEDYGNHHSFLKCSENNYEKIAEEIRMKEIKNEHTFFKNIYSISTNSYKYNLMESVKSLPDFFAEACDPENGNDLYEANLDNVTEWIFKSGE